MNAFYASLTKDLLGVYLEFEAESEQAVRQYLADEYRSRTGEWKLPWCAVYTEIPQIDAGRATIIKAKCGPLTFDLARSMTQRTNTRKFA